MRFLFATLQFRESDFYGRVGLELERLGHSVAHVAYSRRAARELSRTGTAFCLPDEMRAVDEAVGAREVERRYALGSLREVYRTDVACRGRDEAWCRERTRRHYLALERVFDAVGPDVVVPEVGTETMRTAAHDIGLARGARVLFLFFTIFPRPLRLYEDTMHAPIVAPDEVRELSAAERADVERFVAEFTAAGRPIRDHRAPRASAAAARDLARHLAVKALWDRDNPYLRPAGYVTAFARERVRASRARPLYAPVPDRPFVYFPLHVTDDYKIARVIPHCADQAALAERVAAALPPGVDLVLKEHPLSIGRNPLGWLRRLAEHDRMHLVAPRTSSHELTRRAEAVAVISSTVGLEALLRGRPVLTLGEPFYSGYGVTLDAASLDDIPELVPAVLRFRPDRERTLRFLGAAMRACRPGRPVAVDGSDRNAAELAASLDAAARKQPAALRSRPEAVGRT